MAEVVLNRELARQFTNGETNITVEAVTMRALIRELDERYPGIAKVLGDGMAVAIDGQIFQDFFLEEVGPNSEVCFLPAIEGG